MAVILPLESEESMTDKKFDAILAKNSIARACASSIREGEKLNPFQIIGELRCIEEYLGEANQPCVDNLFEFNQKENQPFYI